MSEKIKIIILVMGISFVFLITIILYILLSSTPKKIWLIEYNKKSPSLICSFFINREETAADLKKHNIDYDKCISLVAVSANSCIEGNRLLMPNRINFVESKRWGIELGNCIGSDFYERYLNK